MLVKLLKYDFRAAKMLLPFYGASLLLNGFLILFSALGVFTPGVGKPVIFTVLGVFLAFFAIFSMFAVLGVSIAYAALHFGKQTIGAQGQLMFTLPVSAKQFLLSKLISSMAVIACAFVYIISMFISYFVSGTMGATASMTNDGVQSTYVLNNSSTLTTNLSFGEGVIVITGIAVIVLLVIMFSILLYYFSVAISGYISQNRVLGTLLAFVISGFALQIGFLIVVVITGAVLASTGVFQAIYSGDINSFSMISSAYIFIGAFIALLAAGNAGLYAACRHFYTKKLNLP